MVEVYDQIQFRKETIAEFEQSMSCFRVSASGSYAEERVVSGSKATILVGGTGNASATQRGRDGEIPARKNNRIPRVVTLKEFNDLVHETEFDSFAAQGNGIALMQSGVVKVINRAIDDSIIEALDSSTTIYPGAATSTPNNELISDVLKTLDRADIDTSEQDKMFAAVTPKTWRVLETIPEFASKDYTDVAYYEGPSAKYRKWRGLNWFKSNRLPGVGTATEKNFIYHRDALAFAPNSDDMMVFNGHNEEQGYYWARATIFMGATVLQNSGIVTFRTDDS